VPLPRCGLLPRSVGAPPLDGGQGRRWHAPL